MQPRLETDNELLALAFPEFASQITSWRAVNTRLGELCRDYLTLKRSYLGHSDQADETDEAFLKHLHEAMQDLGHEIEAQLGKMNAAKQTLDRES